MASFRDGMIVYHRSQIHFALAHAAEIAVYNPKTGKDFTIFPRKPYQPVRQSEVAKLTEFFKYNEAWCDQHNNSCNPDCLIIR